MSSRDRLRALWADARDYRVLRASKYGLAPLLVLVTIDLVQEFDNVIFGAFNVEIRRSFGVSITTITAVTSAMAIVTLLARPLIGYLTDRVRRTRMIGISSIVTGGFASLTGGAPTLGTLGVIRGGDKLGESVGDTPIASLIADYYPVEARGKAYAFRQLAQSLAAIAAPLTVAGIGVRYGWRAPFLVAGPLLVGGGVLALTKLQEPVRGYWERVRLGAPDEVASEPDPPMTFAEALRAVLATRVLKRVALAFAVFTVGQAWFGALFSFYLAEKFNLNALDRQLLVIPAHITAMLGVVVGGAMVDRLVGRRPQRVLVFLGLILAAGAATRVVTVLVPSLIVLVVFNAVGGLAGGILGPASATVFSLAVPPRLRGQGLGLLALCVLPAQLLAPVAGQLAGSYGLHTALLLTAPFSFVGGLLYMSAAGFFAGDVRAATAAAMAGDEYRRAKAADAIKQLVVRDADVHYGSVQVLFGIDLVIEEGEIVALLGTNGAGKSTLLRAISGTQPASNGAILFDGRDITHLPPHEISRLGVVHMPGGRGTFPGLTVRENLDLALWSVPTDEQASRRDEVFGFFPVLRDLLDKPAGLLSGGEQQMVALSQAFCARPRLLMIDELSLGLAPAVVRQLLEIIRAIHAQGTTIVLVEQSVNVALTVAERAVFLEKGTVRFEGPTRLLLNRPDIMRAVYIKGSAALPGTGRSRPGGGGPAGRPVLAVRDLTKRFGGVTAVDHVTFTLHDGEALGFVGPNGAGKTTVFDLLSGYQAPDAGSVVLDGVDITRYGADARARLGLVRRFQDARLFPALSVFEAICLALESRLDVRNTFVTALQLPAVRRSERRARLHADNLVELLELGEHRDKFVAELSTGMRRIVDLACAIAANPKVLLLDEPSTGIAQAEAEQLGPLLRRVRYETGCSLLIIEHDVALIAAVADELVAMVQGAVVVQGGADQVLAHPTVVEAYLGTTEDVLQRQGALPS